MLKTNENEIKLLKNEISRLKEVISNKKENKDEKEIKNKKLKNKTKNKDNIINGNKDIKINEKIEYSYIKNNLEEKKDIKIEKVDKNLNENVSLFFKISLLGSSCVGKSSIVQKYLSLPIDDAGHTISNHYITYLKVNNTVIGTHIFDHPGQEVYRSIALHYSKESDLIIFVYNDYENFEVVKKLIKNVKSERKKNIHYALVNSLSNPPNEKQISKEEGEELAKSEGIDLFMEVSHYTGYNINNLFFEIGKILYLDKK